MKRLHRAPIHRLVVGLLVVVVVLVGAVLAIGAVRWHRTNDDLARAEGRLSTPSGALAAAETHWAAWDEANVAIAGGDQSSLATAVSEGGQAGREWDRYLQTAVGLPGESDAQARYAAAADQFNKVVASATTATQTSGNGTQLHALYLQLVQPITDLRPLYASAITAAVASAHHEIGLARRDALIAVAVATVAVAALAVLVLQIIRRRERDNAVRDREQLLLAQRGQLETRLQRALSMVATEDASYRLIERALRTAAPGVPAELLVADSSRAHFQQVATTDPRTPGCAVSAPMDCPAITRGQTQIWPSSTELDACPWLAEHAGGPCSSTCVPVSIAGKTVGVLRATGPDGQPPVRDTIDGLELVARKAGERVGMLRAFARSETQARTDALTGLLNRRSLEVRLRELTDDGEPYVVAFGDLDHFKLLNDVHGHDTGDRALRMFARVLRDNVRPHDATARYGGEEFVIVLPDCSVSDALAVLERVRDQLAVVQQHGSVPPFTVSFGVATSRPELPYDEVIESADEALLRAKASGRDRVVVAGESVEPDDDVRVATAEVDGAVRGG
jgi:diguanylate cyclase (GGDEF)-like protein